MSILITNSRIIYTSRVISTLNFIALIKKELLFTILNHKKICRSKKKNKNEKFSFFLITDDKTRYESDNSLKIINCKPHGGKNDDGDNGDEKISQFSIYDQNLLTIRSHEGEISTQTMNG
ncbi:hypothetical protein DERP_004022 [Dermatophagoides pteronyssinus]|uniref:Uncharacterized protein n=1 Tax=Dermatophagoides pteronyssinus TaxID=6956 RepID=A0ABQ8J7Z3_DERPT|nr:hypothetical protein DERP_004022 [Dermatophagoides pteronyssinus]